MNNSISPSPLEGKLFTDVELNIANIVSKKTALFYREEAYNTALTAIWMHRDSWNAEAGTPYSAYLMFKAKTAVVDELRTLLGRSGSTKNKATHAQHHYDAEIHDKRVTESAEEEILNRLQAEGVSDFLKLLRHREVMVAHGLMCEKPKQDIAAELDISPGRVSQIIRDIAKKAKKFDVAA